MWKRWARDAVKSVEPAWRSLKCPLRMINFVEGCLPGKITRSNLSYGCCNNPILPPMRKRPFWSMNGRRAGVVCYTILFLIIKCLIPQAVCWAEAIKRSSAEISSLLFSVPLCTACLFWLTKQLWANWTIHVVTCLSLLKEDICCRAGRPIVMDTTDISGGTSFSFSGANLSASSGVDGHSLWGVCSQPGLFHHEGCWGNSDGNNPF